MDFSSMSYEKRTRRSEKWKLKRNIYDAIIQFMFYSISAFWMESIYHIFTFHSVDLNLIYPLLFSISFGSICTVLTGLFPQKMNKVLSVLLTVGLALFYCTEQVYKSLFKVPLVLNLAVGGAGDVTQYWKEALQEIIKNLPAILLIFLPIVLLIFLIRRKQCFLRHQWKVTGSTIVVAVALFFLPIGIIGFKGKTSAIYENYYELNDQSLAAKQMGMLTTFRRDIEGVGRGTNDMDSLLSEGPKETAQAKTVNAATQNKNGSTKKVDTSPNVMKIDFDSLIAKESNDDVKILHNYFKDVTPTNKNKYTGMFQGKNLILLTAESYSPWAVDKKLTPTLYKLTHEGFVFENFYTAIWQTSTSDGEYTALTGLIPDGSQSMKRSKDNLLPFTMARQFNRFGITSRAYHSNSLSYYNRDLTHTNLGYDFYAAKPGKRKDTSKVFRMENANAWPNSDYDCAKATFPRYGKDKIFHTYYMTLSGHCHYSFSGNSMAAKNQEIVKNLPYTEAGKAYIAQNIELDRALKYLIDELKREGKLDQTVIALSADHYPYEMDKKDIDSLAGIMVDEDFDLYKNHFILWNSEIKKPIKVTKQCSSLDILPTLSNLFGFTYDSRLLAGKDILSDTEGLVIFSNKNFITDKVKYNNATKEVTYLVDKSQVPDGYVEDKVKQVKALFTVSAGILENDYYKSIEPYLTFPDYKETLSSKKSE